MFISSHYDKYKERVLVWEKADGRRVVREYDPPFYFYAPSKLGDYQAITGETLKKVSFHDKSSYETACQEMTQKFESDLNPLEKVMMDNYRGKTAPVLTLGFLDIEVDYDPQIGWPRPSHPYAPINALTLYRTDVNEYFTLLVPPPGWDGALPEEMTATNFFICKDERALFHMFFDILEDVDLISGWNSEFFDVPYLGKRAELLFGQTGLKKFAFERGPNPYWGEYERFKGSKEKDIILIIGSRVHLDYLRLFRKFNLEGRQSFTLGAIAEDELEIPKLHYEGSLYDLYRNDFIHFAQYNRRDVEVLVELDKKFKYIQLANEMVHEATVNFPAIFGSVQLIDTAIINFCHEKLNKIVYDRKHKAGQQVEGALVMTPKVGFHRWIGSCDINSLYPSTYRSLNLSPEKIMGQLLEYEAGWRAIYDARLYPDDDLRQNKKVTLLLEGSSYDDALSFTAREMIDFLTEQKFSLSAYGTVLDQGSGEGLLSGVLTYWFKGRKELQSKMKKHDKVAEEILKSRGVSLPDDLSIS